jgi:hypothetical protein
MNLLPFISGTVIKRLPIFTPRTNIIKKLLFANIGLYALYLLGTGPVRLCYRRVFVIEKEAGHRNYLFAHFAHTSLV